MMTRLNALPISGLVCMIGFFALWAVFRRLDPRTLWGLVFIYTIPIPVALAFITQIVLENL